MQWRIFVCAPGGLRAHRCCELDLCTLPPSSADEVLAGQIERADAAFREGDILAAEAMLLQVLEALPGNPTSLRLLYEIRKPTSLDAAEALLQRLVTIEPNDLTATLELVLLLLNRGKLETAEIHARNAIRLAPEHAQAHHLMGMVMTGLNRPQFGEYHYQRAMELIDERDALLLFHFGWNQQVQGKMAAGRQLYEQSLALDPALLRALLSWVQLEEADRNLLQAEALLARAERLAPGNQSVLLLRAVLHARRGAYGDALAALDAIERQGEDNLFGPNELLEKGYLLDRMGRHDEAFLAFARGKQLLRETSGQHYRAEDASELAARLKDFFTKGRLAILPRAATVESAAQPIFILGFPRAGTTLVEQTLTAHPRISAGDELPFIREVAEMAPRVLNSPLPYPDALSELWMGDQRNGLDALRDHYLRRAVQFGAVRPDTPWFTDKMPLNEAHLGLISLLFPKSPLLHVVRHPLDVVLSVFSNQLTHGFYCSYALESAAQHLVLTSDLLEHYIAEAPVDVLTIRYEYIIEHQEAAVREMLEFIGEPFDSRCLHFEENKRYARTASYAQVTEKLYDRSRFRYRRYLRHLEPVIPILKPLIERLGYSIDSD